MELCSAEKDPDLNSSDCVRVCGEGGHSHAGLFYSVELFSQFECGNHWSKVYRDDIYI